MPDELDPKAVIAAAFGVPPSLLGMAPADSGQVPVSNHCAGLAMDINSTVNPYTGKPIPGEMYLEGDGDPFMSTVKPYMTFDVLGKAQPVVATGPAKHVWENELGKVVQQGGIYHVSLTGIVSTGTGTYQLGGEIGTTDLELAKKLIGVIPNDGPGTGIQVLEQTVDGQVFTWEAGTGWIPKPDYGPLHASLPEIPTTKGGVKYPTAWPSKISGWPEDSTRHTGPDGAVWEFNLSGGWIIVQQPDELFGGGERAPYGWWCSACSEHWSVHKGDPVGCDSGGWLRPATSAEHKEALLAL
jgi:hypothetical protein